MSSLLDEPPARPIGSPAQRLRATMAAVRVSFTWLGVRKSLSTEQKAREMHARARPMQSYLARLCTRMHKRGFPADDPLLQVAVEARDKLQELAMACTI